MIALKRLNHIIVQLGLYRGHSVCS